MDINNKNNIIGVEINLPSKTPSQPTDSDLELKKTINETLRTFIEVHLSIPLHEKKIERLMKFNEFMNDIVSKSSNIPPQYLTEPRFDIVGASLEKYKYQFEDKQIVEILKKIIVKTMDTRFSDNLKFYYIDIVSQLSPSDIKILKDLKNNKNEFILKIHILEKNISSNLYTTVSATCLELTDLSLNLLDDFNESLDNLARLNLLVPFEPTVYLNEQNTPRAIPLFENIKTLKNLNCSRGYKLEYELSAYRLTDLAKNIITLCLE